MRADTDERIGADTGIGADTDAAADAVTCAREITGDRGGAGRASDLWVHPASAMASAMLGRAIQAIIAMPKCENGSF
ncbi:MAG: hypothetical protein ACREJ3_12485 [Polyangiaceae bacterium]